MSTEIDPTATAQVDQERGGRQRLLEWVLVIAIAFGPVIFSQLSTWWAGARLGPHVPQDLLHGFIPLVIQELLVVAVLAYVLFRQGRSPADLGLSFAWTDPLEGLVLLLLGVAVSVAISSSLIKTSMLDFDSVVNAYLPFRAAAIVTAANRGGFAAATLFLLFGLVTTLVAVGYTVTEIEELSKSRVLAFLTGFGLQLAALLRGDFITRVIIASMILEITIYFMVRRRTLPILFFYVYYFVVGLLGTVYR